MNSPLILLRALFLFYSILFCSSGVARPPVSSRIQEGRETEENIKKKKEEEEKDGAISPSPTEWMRPKGALSEEGNINDDDGKRIPKCLVDPFPDSLFKTFFLLFSFDIISFLAGSCFFLPLTPYSLQSPPSPLIRPLSICQTYSPSILLISTGKKIIAPIFSHNVCGGGGSWSIKNMILAREERGQHACIARWFLFIIPLIITYPKERNERIEKRIRPKPFAPPGTPSGLWRYAQFVFIIENETRRGS